MLVNGESPQAARAALTHPSQRPFEILIVAPASVAVRVNFAVPDAPVVVAGSPPQNSIVPAMPPQMLRMATLISWLTSVLNSVLDCVNLNEDIRRGGEGRG